MRLDDFHDTKILIEGQAKALRCNGDTITLLCIRNSDDDGEEKYIQTTRKVTNGNPATRAEDDDELRDLDSEPEEDTTEANLQDLNELEESNHDVDSNPSFRSVPQDDDASKGEAKG